MAGGFVVGSAQCAAFGATEAFTRVGLITGNLADAVMAGWNGGLMGAAIGGPLGAIFHDVCFVAGTLVHSAIGKRAIETLRVGQRTLTAGTQDAASVPGDDPTQVDPANWRLVRLRTAKPAGSDNLVDVELLRPLAWIEQIQAVVGSQIHFELAELGIDGPACVLAIEPCPKIEPGRGRVITGTFSTARCHFLDLRPVGSDEILHPTPSHRFYSVDRNDYVPAEDLRPGEPQEPTAPRIDDQWLDTFPEHADYTGEKLILHHAQWVDPTTGQIENGPFLQPVPQSLHRGQEGVWHGGF
jgi:hypothetical protein